MLYPVAGVITVVGLLAPFPAAGSPGPELQLEYTHAEGCPSREDFVRQLLGRARHAEALLRSEISVFVSASDSGYSGRLKLVDPKGNVAEREVAGVTCSDVAAALALVAVVVVDNASGPAAPTGDSATSTTHGVGDAPKAAPDAKLFIAEPNPRRNNAKADVTTPHKPEDAHPQSFPRRSPNEYSVGLVGGYHNAISPSWATVAGISAAYHPGLTWGHPEYRIEGLVGWSGQSTVTSMDGDALGSAEFNWFAARASACPARLATRGVRVGPCAFLELGMLSGTGTSAGGVQSKTGFWIAPGILLDWSLEVGPFRLRLAGGALLPLVRDRFLFRPETLVVQAPTLGSAAEIDVALTFN